MKELPDDLAALEIDDLNRQRSVRDELLTPLFRRWPALSRLELRDLKKLYTERVRIAKYLGSAHRSGRASAGEPGEGE